jgi:hypothetical protein
MADQQTTAERKLEEQRRKWAKNLSTARIQRAGVSDATLDLERQALDYCKAQGHTQRERGKVPCRDCSQEALMGRLGQQRDSVPPLPPGLESLCYQIDPLLRSGGRWSLESLAAKVNEGREGKGQRSVTPTNVSARLRDIRKAIGVGPLQGVDPEHGAVYWYPAPGQPATDLGE